jgi:hypothetical protein
VNANKVVVFGAQSKAIRGGKKGSDFAFAFAGRRD